MSADAAASVLGAESLAALAGLCDLAPLPVLDDFTTRRARTTLADVELLITGWGCPPVDAAVLKAAPRLRAVVHTAGTVRGHLTEACWERGIRVSSAAAANALPVAEYTVAMVLLSGKHVLERSRAFRADKVRGNWLGTSTEVGNYGRTVGILSASMIGRRVIELLLPYDLPLLLHDPYVSDAEADALGVRPVGLAELFARSDVVSVHTPCCPPPADSSAVNSSPPCDRTASSSTPRAVRSWTRTRSPRCSSRTGSGRSSMSRTPRCCRPGIPCGSATTP